MEYRTLKDLKAEIDELEKLNPKLLDLPLISSSDEEGNSYRKVYNSLTPAQVHDIREWDLELVGFLDEEMSDDKIVIDDINCICIN